MSPEQPQEEFGQRVLSQFNWLKDAGRPREAWERGFQLEGGIGHLVPVGRCHLADEALIERLARWRELNMSVYPTQFTVTFEGTAAWLRDLVVAVPDRVMFLVHNPDGQQIGHCGLADAFHPDRLKLDNLVRGRTGGPPGMMNASVRAILQWAHVTLGAMTVVAPVATDNESAFRFLLSVGFDDEKDLIPLRRVVSGDRTEFVPCAPGDERPPDRHQNRLVYRVPACAERQEPRVGGHPRSGRVAAQE